MHRQTVTLFFLIAALVGCESPAAKGPVKSNSPATLPLLLQGAPVSTDEDLPAQFSLAVENSADDIALQVLVDAKPAHGTLSITQTLALEYTPETNFHGTDRIRLHAVQGERTSEIIDLAITVKPVNDAPTLDSALLSSTSFHFGDTIAVVPVGGADVDGDAVSFRYQWYVDGLLVPGADESTLENGFVKGQSVYAVVVPYDGTMEGTAVDSELAVIGNSPPAVTSLTLLAAPSPATTNSQIEVDVSAVDGDGDPLAFQYTWYVAGVSIPAVTGTTLGGTHFARGDTVDVVVLVSDGFAETRSRSAAVLIGSTPPSAPNLQVSSSMVNGWTGFSAVAAGSTDIDGDAVSYTYAWSRDGIDQGYPASQTTVSPDETSPGEIWIVTARATDGSASSAAVTGAVEIIHSVPIANGTRHACALTPDWGVRCWGIASLGALGNADASNLVYPYAVTSVGMSSDAAISLAAGNSFTCAIRKDRRIVCWGYGANGALGTGGTSSISIPDGYVLNSVLQPVTGAVEVVATQSACARFQDGSVRCWGSDGNLTATPVSGFDGLTRKAVSLAGGYRGFCAATDTGAVYCWGGSNTYGVLGSCGSPCPTPQPVLGFGEGMPAVQVTMGEVHSCARLSSGAVMCWGNNALEIKQFGNPEFGATFSTTPVPVSLLDGSPGMRAVDLTAGHYHTCAIREDEQLVCWGLLTGLLGSSSDKTYYDIVTQPAPVSGYAEPLVRLAVGGYNVSRVCGYSAAGKVYCHGRVYTGETAQWYRGSAAAVKVTESTFTSIDAGDRMTCARNTSGEAYCTGVNSLGQLGIGNPYTSGLYSYAATFTPVAGLSSAVSDVASGQLKACAVKSNGAVLCWGRESRGVLGMGNTSVVYDTPIDMSGLSNIVSMDIQDIHACAIDTVGALWCWGDNQSGQLGNGSSGAGLYSTTPVGVSGIDGASAVAVTVTVLQSRTCVLLATGAVRCWGSGYTPTPSTVPGLDGITTPVVALASGTGHSCVVLNTGGVKCWGSSCSSGELGNGNTACSSQWTPVDVSGLSTGAQRIDAKNKTTCASLADRVVCWGDNDYGKAGAGLATMVSTPQTVSGIAGEVADLAVGNYHACALRTNGDLYCWGMGQDGEQGSGRAFWIPEEVPLP